jgi:hypothetical protein
MFAALIVALQTVFPAVALAEVSMRCAGMPASSSCAKEVLPVTNTEKANFANMPCCRHMAAMRQACPMDMAIGSVQMPVKVMTVSSPKCLISINPLSSSQPVVIRSVHKWLLNAAPALAPPSNFYSLTSFTTIIIARQPQPNSLALAHFALSHGLRAPPVA